MKTFCYKVVAHIFDKSESLDFSHEKVFENPFENACFSIVGIWTDNKKILNTDY